MLSVLLEKLTTINELMSVLSEHGTALLMLTLLAILLYACSRVMYWMKAQGCGVIVGWTQVALMFISVPILLHLYESGSITLHDSQVIAFWCFAVSLLVSILVNIKLPGFLSRSDSLSFDYEEMRSVHHIKQIQFRRSRISLIVFGALNFHHTSLLSLLSDLGALSMNLKLADFVLFVGTSTSFITMLMCTLFAFSPFTEKCSDYGVDFKDANRAWFVSMGAS